MRSDVKRDEERGTERGNEKKRLYVSGTHEKRKNGRIFCKQKM